MRSSKYYVRAAFIGLCSALAVVAGCGSDDDGSAPPSIAGEYEATIDLDGSGTAEIEIEVAEDGDAEGTVILRAETAAAVSGVGPVLVTVLGFADPSTGEFELSGTFTDIGGPVTVRLTGVLPAPGRDGSIWLEVGDQTYGGTLTQVAVPTPVFTPTSTPGSGSTPTPTNGAGPTNTPGGTSGISPDMLGVWSGTARNDTTGTRLDVRLRIEAAGNDAVVTDLNGNIFQGTNRLTMVVRTPTALTYNAIGATVVNFTLNLTSPSTVVGLYGVTTTTLPPTITSLALDLRPGG